MTRFNRGLFVTELSRKRVEHGYAQLRAGGEPARIALRQIILTTLTKIGPMTSADMRGENLFFAGLEEDEEEHVNIHAWALHDLVRKKEIVKIGKVRRTIVDKATPEIKPRHHWDVIYALPLETRPFVDPQPDCAPVKMLVNLPSSSSPAPVLQQPAPPSLAKYWVDRADLLGLMAWNNKIKWTGQTLNCIVGCTKLTRACKHCYAVSTLARNLHPFWDGVVEKRGGKQIWTGRVNYDLTILQNKPATWSKRPQLAFFTSLSDPFHASLTMEQIQDMLDGCAAHPRIIWQWLTKRPERAAALAGKLRWPKNIWIGATIEADSEVRRADELRKVPVATKFISAEPLTTDALPNLDLTDIAWLIVGGESGHGAEPMDINWARSLRDRAVAANVPFFFKQWGKFGPSGQRRIKDEDNTHLDGREWFQFPTCVLDHAQKFERHR